MYVFIFYRAVELYCCYCLLRNCRYKVKCVHAFVFFMLQFTAICVRTFPYYVIPVLFDTININDCLPLYMVYSVLWY